MRTRQRLTRAQLKQSVPYYVLLAPFLVFFIIFMLVPVISAFALSFTDFNAVQMPNFVGLSNYVRIFIDDEIFMKSLRNTLVFALVTGPIGYILSFVVAWLIHELGRFTRSIVTFLVYVPSITANAYVIWSYILSSDRVGFLNNLLLQLGLTTEPISFLSDVKYNFICCIVVTLWMSFGTGFLAFVSGLQALDKTYYEAAALDGLRNRWQELYYVTFPQMGPQLLFGAVMTISSAFSVGSVNQTLTGNPSTDYSTHTILLHSADYAGNRLEMGYAAALSMVLFVLMVVTWGLTNRALRKFND